jgi:hypothetical protein
MNIRKTTSILLGIILLAFLLRYSVAGNLHVNADEAVYATNALGFIDSGRISIFEQSPVYYYLVDLVYKTIGYSTVASRLLSIIGGTLSVVLLFLITRKFYNEKIALLVGFLFAISGFAIAHNTEMDMLMYFFILLSMYFLIQSLTDKGTIRTYMILSMVSYVIAVLIKPLAIPSIVPLGIYYIHKRRNRPITYHIKTAGTLFIIGIIMSLPVLTYNYILYTERGIVDGVFSEYLGIDVETYKDYGYDKGWTLTYFKSKFIGVFSLLSREDFFILIFGLFGLFIALRKHKNDINYLLLPMAFVYIYFMGIHGGPNHYLIFPIIFSIYSAIGIQWIITRKEQYVPFFSSFSEKKILLYLCVIIFIVNIFVIRGPLTEKAATNKLQEYFTTVDKENALIILDPNIYTAMAHHVFANHHFIWAHQFTEHAEQFSSDPSPPRIITSYFIYCASGDCGWGGRAKHREIVQRSAERFIEEVYDGKEPVATFSDNLRKGSFTYHVYKQYIRVPSDYFHAVDWMHFFFSHSFKYLNDKKMFDYIDKNTLSSGKKLLYSLSRMILIIDSVLALLLIVYSIFLLRR